MLHYVFGVTLVIGSLMSLAGARHKTPARKPLLRVAGVMLAVGVGLIAI